MYIYIVQSADMHVSAFYTSSVQLGTHPHMWLHCIYTHTHIYRVSQKSGVLVWNFNF